MQNETQCCLECATAGICCELRGERCTCCGTVGPATIASRKFYESQSDFRARAFEAVKAFEAALVASAPEVSEVPVMAVKKARCPHYGAIKEFFSVARELGFDTSKDSQDRWRGAIGILLGRRVASRSELTGSEWAFATKALRMGRLFI